MASTIVSDLSDWEREYYGWFLNSYPQATALVMAGYLYFVLNYGQRFMKDRPAFELKGYLVFYNLVQIAACVYLINEIHSTVTIYKFWKCCFFQPDSEAERKMRTMSYFVYWLKFVELTETIVFILRKKMNQVSTLHVVHHCSTIYLAILNAKYTHGGRGLFSIYINSYVHIIMYSYYLLAVILDKETLKKLITVKKSITIIQMLQFILLLTQVIFYTVNNCESNKFLQYSLFSVLVLMLFMFYDFYSKAYHTKKIKQN